MQLNLRQVQQLQLKTELKQILTPMLIQSLKILNLPYQDLTDRLQHEAEENVVVDVDRQDELLSYFREANKTISSTIKVPDEERFSALQRVASADMTLHEHLFVQLELEYLEEPDQSIARELIEHINEKGFIEEFPELKTKLMSRFGVAENRVKQLLSLIQSFDPPGVGARNVKESLLLQVRSYSFEDDFLRETLEQIIQDYLEELAEGEYDEVALELDLDREDVERAADFIQNNLSPVPAQSFTSHHGAIQVVPSFEIRKENGKYVFINLEREKGIRVTFNQKYIKLLESPDTDEETKRFIREKLQAAKRLVDMINRRYDMLDRIGGIILERQKDFFEKGIHYLMPISQREIAEQADVHPSTISRAVASKYIYTPVGILPVKYLCPREFSGMAVERIKYILRDVIDEHPGMSDRKIAEYLERYGIHIKRRTVAKYRNSLELPSSYERS